MKYTKNMTKLANRSIKYIVIHYTAGITSKSGSANNTANYFNKESTKASADFIVDDGGYVQYNEDIKNQYTWHCGGTFYAVNKGGSYYKQCKNSNSIGIEICSNNTKLMITNPNDTNYYFTNATLDNAVELVKQLMKEYDIPLENVIRHYDVTSKLCPGIVGWNIESGSEEEWNKFKDRLQKEKPQVDIKATIQTIIKSLQELLDIL